MNTSGRLNKIESGVMEMESWKKDRDNSQLVFPLDIVTRGIVHNDLLVFSQFVEAVALGTDGGIDVNLNGRHYRLIKSVAN